MNLINTDPIDTDPIDTDPNRTDPIDTALAALTAAGINFDVLDTGPEEGSADLDVAA